MRTTKSETFRKFANLLRTARRARGVTQGALASQLGVGQQAVSNWERGTSRPETRQLTSAVAALFKETREEEWLDAAGHRRPRSPIDSKPPGPSVDSLPFGQLTPTRFQDFAEMLLRCMYPDATVNQLGVAGDAQDGVDIEARFPGGRYEVYQCKRVEEFGRAKVKVAFKKIKRSYDRAVILLSRPATASARSAIPRSQLRRALWDSAGLVQEIRQLQPSEQKKIVRTFFPSFLRDFLGIDPTESLESPDEHFGRQLDRGQLFSHAWTLVGRENELQRLLVLADRKQPTAILLVGAGGIGKSRIVRAVSSAYTERHPDRAVRILAATRSPTPADLEFLTERPALVVVEDAHDRGDLEALVLGLVTKNPRIHFLILTRPYAASSVRADLARCGLRIEDDDEVTLQALSIENAERVAREILTDRGGQIERAPAIAELTRGSTLALVVGSYLVASEKIHPGALNNSKDFSDQIFRAFRDAITGGIGPPSERAAIATTLNLTALVQPIDPDTPAFDKIIEDGIGLSPPTVKRAMELLYRAGVLARRGRFFSIVPDLLAEYVMQQTCLSREARINM